MDWTKEATRLTGGDVVVLVPPVGEAGGLEKLKLALLVPGGVDGAELGFE